MGPDQLHTYLRSRRSVRRFQSRPVPDDVIHRILETGTWAPSAHNRQPWRFVVLTTPAAKTRLGTAMATAFRQVLEREGLNPETITAQVNRSRQRIEQAPVAVVLCLDPSGLAVYTDQDRSTGEYTMAVQSVALAGGTILLAAHAEGLGGVWVCAPLFTPRIVQEALDLPATWVSQGMILLGFADTIPEPRPRMAVSDVARFI